MAAYTVSVGSGQVIDTYLSPLKFDGQSFSLDYERRQAMKFNPRNWTMRLDARLEGIHAKSPSGATTLWEGMLHLQWGMTRRWMLPYSITAAVGGSTSLDAGVVYNDRNSNNPASAKGAWTVNLTGYATWNVRLGRLPITLTYQPTLPLTGIFFSPDYGELYYEIYLGNRSGLVHPAWWGNYFKMENLLTADLHLGKTCLRVGFRSNVLSTKVNHITTRIVSTCFVIGVSGRWVSW